MIIQVNNELVVSGIGRPSITINQGETKKSFGVDYVPGKLTMSQNAWELITNDTIGSFDFQFDYYTSKGQNLDIKRFKAILSKNLLDSNYLIINIYDFRNRKYRKWYGPYTEEDYLVELNYPNGPIYVRYN